MFGAESLRDLQEADSGINVQLNLIGQAVQPLTDAIAALVIQIIQKAPILLWHYRSPPSETQDPISYFYDMAIDF